MNFIEHLHTLPKKYTNGYLHFRTLPKKYANGYFPIYAVNMGVKYSCVGIVSGGGLSVYGVGLFHVRVLSDD